ncbi:urokinase plasminogen activator surface receptor-like [Astyanax mexicanus]|uniref:Plasminogen activator, urokinase receptor n=1 Tax=Astyanax mexicanus TaxID=7994 RepID=A0A8B9JS42_ASTMX|nr:urokinase plasminogen activator surface receptor-like [Astyanax mexicanus]
MTGGVERLTRRSRGPKSRSRLGPERFWPGGPGSLSLRRRLLRPCPYSPGWLCPDSDIFNLTLLSSFSAEIKMIQSALLILISALSCEVLSLTCYQCIPETSVQCTDQKVNCPTGQCGNMKTTAYMGSTVLVNMVMKNCSLAQHCVTASVNFGITKTTISNQCCNTDLCNAQRKPEATSNTPNGLQCYTCNGEDCSSTLDCVDEEDHCIKSAVGVEGQKLMMKGCATKSFCMGDLSAQLAQSSTVVGLSCCTGNLCNGATIYTQNFLLLGLLLAFTTLH